MLRRKIPLNYRNVTGVASSRLEGSPTHFESLLEYDFIRLLRFDDVNVESFESQCPIILYTDDSGKSRRYTPDVYVRYTDEVIVYEVKPRELLKKHWAELKPKFKQAIRYTKARGWKFRIVTEVEIRTVYLKNVRFLESYKNVGNYDPRYKQILDNLRNFGASTPDQIIASVGHSQKAKAELLYTLWQLVADNVIGVDLNEQLSMESEIWYRLEGRC